MRQRKILSTAISGVLLASACHAMPAYAAAPAAAPAALEELIVTAQRREESILETPVTVTAIGSDLLEMQNVNTVTDLVALTPGLEIEPDGGRTSIRLRGLATTDGSPASENIAALHVDNIYMSHRTALAGYFYDVDRVEVLQGPQGTLYGRNTAAGSLNIISRRPVQEVAASAEVQFGSYGWRQVEGMLNIPITDTFAVRSAFQSNTFDGYYDSGIDERRATYGRVSALWTPTDRVSAFVKLDFGDAWRRGNGTSLLGVINHSDPNNWTVTMFDEDRWLNDRLSHPENAFGTPPSAIDQSFVSNKFWGLMTELTFDITDNVAFIVNAARIEEKYKARTVNVSGVVNAGCVGYGCVGGPIGDQVIGEPWLEEVIDARFQGTLAGQLDWTLGYFNFSDDTNEPAGNANGIAFHAAESLSKSEAYYGQVTWTPPALDRLHLTAGGRTSTDKKNWDFHVVLFNSFDVGGSGGPRNKKWENDDWKLGIAFDLTDDSMLYANASTGFRSGSWFPGPLPQYDPEYVDAYEIGWKGRFLDGRLDLSANAFTYDWKDMAIGFDAFNLVSQEDEVAMFNLGLAKIRGLNIGGNWLVTDDDLITFNVDYIKSEIKEFDFATALAQFGPNYDLNTVFDWTGLDLPNTTPLRITLAWNHTFNFSNGGTLDSRIQSIWNDSRYYGYRENTLSQYEFEGYKIDSYVTLDWNLMYRPADRNWSAGFYVRNLTDELVINNVGGGGNAPTGTLAGTLPAGQSYLTGGVRAPREFGLRLGVEF